MIVARTLYELSDGTQVNIVLRPDGLQSFHVKFKRCRRARLERQPVRVLPLARVIASKRAAGREKDFVSIPILERTLRLQRRLKNKRAETRRKKRLF